MSGGGGELRQARKLTRRPTLLSLSLHSAVYRKTPGLYIAERKGHPFMHMQEDKFSPQPPVLRAAQLAARRRVLCSGRRVAGGSATCAPSVWAWHRPFKKSSAGGRRSSSRRRQVHLRTVPVLRNPFPAGTSSSLCCS